MALELLTQLTRYNRYDSLDGCDKEYFVKWFPLVRPDLKNLDGIDYRVFSKLTDELSALDRASITNQIWKITSKRPTEQLERAGGAGKKQKH